MNVCSIFDDWLLEWVVGATHLPNIRPWASKMTPLSALPFAHLLLGLPVFQNNFCHKFFTGLLDIICFQFQCSHIFAAFPDRPRRKLSAAIWSLPLRCQRHSAHLYLRYLVMHLPTCLDSAGSSTMSKTLFLPIWSWTPSSGQSQAALMTN